MGSSRDLKRLTRRLQEDIARIAAREKDRFDENTPIEDLFSGQVKLPLRTDALRKTPVTILKMTESEMQDWIRKIESSRDTLQRLLDRPKLWDKLEARGDPDDDVAYIALGELP
jgi:hypothetical protein